MTDRVKGRTLVARDEGDAAGDVVIKLYGEETGGAVSINEQPLGPGLLSPPPGPGLGSISTWTTYAHARGGFHG